MFTIKALVVLLLTVTIVVSFMFLTIGTSLLSVSQKTVNRAAVTLLVSIVLFVLSIMFIGIDNHYEYNGDNIEQIHDVELLERFYNDGFTAGRRAYIQAYHDHVHLDTILSDFRKDQRAITRDYGEDYTFQYIIGYEDGIIHQEKITLKESEL